MNKKMKAVILAICAILVLAGFGVYAQKGSRSLVSAVGAGTKQTIDLAAPLGTEKNPFTILEIVPYKGMASLGYLVEGQEPVDLREFCRTDGNVHPNIYDQGELKFLGVGSDESKMNYTFYDSATAWSYKGEDGKVYQCRGKIRNNELFKKEVLVPALGITEGEKESFVKNYKVEVLSVTPEELNLNVAAETINYIDRASMIFINGNPANTGYLDLYEKYTEEGRQELVKYGPSSVNNGIAPDYYKTYQEDKGGNPKDNDINWIVAEQLLVKIGVDKTPLMADYGYLVDDAKVKYYVNGIKNEKASAPGTSNNMSKLVLMLNQLDVKPFYEVYVKTGHIKEAGNFTDENTGFLKPTIGTFDYFGIGKAPAGSDLKKSKTYWNSYTFIYDELQSYVKNKNLDESGDKTPHSAHDNIFNYRSSVDYFGKEIAADIFSGSGFDEVFDYLESQGVKPRPTSASALDIMQFLLKAPLYGGKDKLRILDIEPSKMVRNVQEESEFRAKRKEELMDFLPGMDADNVTINYQTSSEFNGKIEDLNSTYDLIYLGLDFDGLRLNAAKTAPKYNDTSLDGKIYLHVGDSMKRKSAGGFDINWLKDQTTKDKSRFGGNDITDLRMKSLENFLNAGYPILTASDLHALNENKVDKSSVIYKFVRDNNAKLISWTDPSVKDRIKKGVSIRKPELVLLVQPNQYRGEVGSDGKLAPGQYLPNKLFEFEFQIKDSKGGTYNVDVYIDGNADGRFAENELLKSVTCAADGSIGIVSQELPEVYLGALPWKIEAYRDATSKGGDKAYRTSVTGLAAVARKEAQKERIRVLQITTNGGGNLNLEKETKKAGTNFQKYTENLNDYKIEFETVTIDEFEKLYTNGARFVNTDKFEKVKTDKLAKNYEMLIFGFADYYADISNVNGALDNVLYFIDLGKSVLFTHDVTSFNNKTVGSEGYIFNLMFRDVLSMDRFGARANPVGSDINGRARDKAISAGKTYKEIHGYTYSALSRIGAPDTNKGETHDQFLPFNTTSKFFGNPVLTKKVTKLNEGQITGYPYHIDDILPVAQTHGQYYQLDLEDPEIVTWYCLADDIYDLSPNDARDNYYIYNKGNITYSGVGHSSIKSDETSKGDAEETKLFINTMIASYKSVAANPQVDLTDRESAPDGKGGWYCFFTLDEQNRDTNYGEIIVEFEVKDPNPKLEDKLGLSIQLPDNADLEVYDSAMNQVKTTMQSFDKKSTLLMVKRQKYYFKYKLENYYKTVPSGSPPLNKAIIYVENLEGKMNISEVTFAEKQLFDLD